MNLLLFQASYQLGPVLGLWLMLLRQGLWMSHHHHNQWRISFEQTLQ
jgi:hypothetical protein